jgi:hypothetical protein
VAGFRHASTYIRTVTTLAGNAGDTTHISKDEFGTNAVFDDPSGIAIASSGTIYVSDELSQAVRALSSGASGFVKLLSHTTHTLDLSLSHAHTHTHTHTHVHTHMYIHTHVYLTVFVCIWFYVPFPTMAMTNGKHLRILAIILVFLV